MYKNIMVATDGSKLSSKAVKAAIALAKPLGAKLVVFYASPDYPLPVYAEGAVFSNYVSKSQYAKEREAFGQKLLDDIARQADAAGIPAQTEYGVSNAPFEAILKAAGRRKCDLIVMASHGRRGVSALLLGSETQKVLTHSKLPVLVVR